jgi:AcrR family transcriptional regulator
MLTTAPDSLPDDSSPRDGRNAGSRGQRARDALIQAGVEVFGENSLDSATTREIAQRAGQNIAAIAYYFGGKEGLYLAVVERIAGIIDSRIGPLMQEIETYLRGPKPAPARCLDYMGELLASSIATHSDMLAVTSIIVKEQMHPTRAFDVLYAGGSAACRRRARRCCRPIAGYRWTRRKPSCASMRCSGRAWCSASPAKPSSAARAGRASARTRKN